MVDDWVAMQAPCIPEREAEAADRSLARSQSELAGNQTELVDSWAESAGSVGQRDIEAVVHLEENAAHSSSAAEAKAAGRCEDSAAVVAEIGRHGPRQ